MLAQQLVNAISLGGVYALFALGFTLIFGVLNVVNLAHGAMFMLGAYTALQAVLLFKLPLAAAVLAAIAVTAGAGWLLDRFIFAPLRARQAPHLAPMIATIGLAISLNSTIQGIFGAENLRFPVHGLAADGLRLGGVQITWLELQIIFLALLLMAVLLWWLMRTRMGTALRALAESRKAAALLGIDVEGLFRLTSVIASLLGGVAGVLIALYTNAVFPQHGSADAAQGHRRGHPWRHGRHPRRLARRLFPRLRRSLFGRLHRLDHARCRGVRLTIRNSTSSAGRIVRQSRPAAGVIETSCGSSVQGSKFKVGARDSSTCGAEINFYWLSGDRNPSRLGKLVSVMPAQAGIQSCSDRASAYHRRRLDSGFRRNDRRKVNFESIVSTSRWL